MATWRKRGNSQSQARAVGIYRGVCVRFATSASGATAVEYALIVALLSVVVVASFLLLGDPIEGLFGGVADRFTGLEINQD